MNVQPQVPREVFELLEIFEQVWPQMRPSGLVCEVPPAGGQGQGDAAAPTAPDVQADVAGLYDLSGAPDELRPFIEQEMKKVEANVTRKFQEAADFRKQWEPLSKIDGLTDIDHEELQGLVQFRNTILNDEDAFSEWFHSVGAELGLLPGEGDDDDDDDDDGEGEDLEAMITRALDARLAPFEQQLTQQGEVLTQSQQEQRLQEAQQQIRTELDGLREQHGDFNEDLVCQLALAYEGADDMIARAYADYQRFTGEAESSFVEGKGDGPAAPNIGGTPATQVEPITDFKTAKEAARARFAAAH